MKKYCRSDLACEASNDLSHIPGTQYSIENFDICILEKLDITSPDACKKLNKKAGRYITFSTPKLQYLDDDDIDMIAKKIGEEISNLICQCLKLEKIGKDLSILVVGIGNSKITADAIGPEVVDKITVTRHIKELDLALFNSLKTCTISAFAPNVLGKTGIESSEMIRAAVNKISPDALIVIDALAARSVERLARTIQISDTGITPGSGIGNTRNELSSTTLGIPVIAIGIPTIVDSATLALDFLESAGISDISDEITSSLDAMEKFFVTLKESDVITEKSSIMLARALAEAFVIHE